MALLVLVAPDTPSTSVDWASMIAVGTWTMAASQMPIVSSQYWNMVHGNTPEEVRQDLEGLQGMRTLARNMVYLIRCIEAGKAAGVPFPKQEQKISTNFIR